MKNKVHYSQDDVIILVLQYMDASIRYSRQMIELLEELVHISTVS